VRKLLLALIAHNSKKEDLVSLIRAHQVNLIDIDLVATRDTGQLIQARTGLPVTLLLAGSQGGDLQIGSLAANGDVDAVIFLRDSLNSQNSEPDITGILKVCDIHNLPLATNLTTAEAILHLIFEHPEALSGHHIVAQYLDDMAAIQE
jgi:methylglyoxal synthase